MRNASDGEGEDETQDTTGFGFELMKVKESYGGLDHQGNAWSLRGVRCFANFLVPNNGRGVESGSDLRRILNMMQDTSL